MSRRCRRADLVLFFVKKNPQGDLHLGIGVIISAMHIIEELEREELARLNKTIPPFCAGRYGSGADACHRRRGAAHSNIWRRCYFPPRARNQRIFCRAPYFIGRSDGADFSNLFAAD